MQPPSAADLDRRRRLVLLLVSAILALVVVSAAVLYVATGPLFPPLNTPPYGLAIVVYPDRPNDSVPVTFFATVSDRETPVNAIEVRWSWETNGTWDTPWSTNKVAQRILAAGTHLVRLQAEDSGGMTAAASTNVSVSATPLPPPVLRLGTVLSLTGSLGAFGQGQQNAVDMAVAEINTAGGVLGEPVQVFHADDHTTPSAAAQAAQALISADHVSAIIGATGSGMCAAVLPVAAASQVLEVSPSCTSPVFSNLSYTGGWFARTVPSDALQASVAAYYVRHNLTLNYSAVLGINNAYGTATAAQYAASYLAHGGNLTDNPPVIVSEVTGGATDYTPVLTQIMSASPAPQLIYLVAYPPDGVQMLENWNALLSSHPSWSSVRWMFSEGLDDPNFINPLVNAGVNVVGFQGTAPAAYVGVEPAGYAAWANRYQGLFGVTPTLFAANAYDAAYLVALAAEAQGAVTGSAVRGSLQHVADPPGTAVGPNGWRAAVTAIAAGQDVDYQGVTGSVNLNAAGDVPSGFIVWAVNATNQIYTKSVFPESLVVSTLPSGTFPQAVISRSPMVAAWADHDSTRTCCTS